jgi:hypothetical protein
MSDDRMSVEREPAKKFTLFNRETVRLRLPPLQRSEKMQRDSLTRAPATGIIRGTRQGRPDFLLG